MMAKGSYVVDGAVDGSSAFWKIHKSNTTVDNR